jgi:hypothetical protein
MYCLQVVFTLTTVLMTHKDTSGDCLPVVDYGRFQYFSFASRLLSQTGKRPFCRALTFKLARPGNETFSLTFSRQEWTDSRTVLAKRPLSLSFHVSHKTHEITHFRGAWQQFRRAFGK